MATTTTLAKKKTPFFADNEEYWFEALRPSGPAATAPPISER